MSTRIAAVRLHLRVCSSSLSHPAIMIRSLLFAALSRTFSLSPRSAYLCRTLRRRDVRSIVRARKRAAMRTCAEAPSYKALAFPAEADLRLSHEKKQTYKTFTPIGVKSSLPRASINNTAVKTPARIRWQNIHETGTRARILPKCDFSPARAERRLFQFRVNATRQLLAACLNFISS